jgi:hypothetical protein
MEQKENPEAKEETREKVLVPVKRRQNTEKEENSGQQTEKVWKMPRRWHDY